MLRPGPLQSIAPALCLALVGACAGQPEGQSEPQPGAAPVSDDSGTFKASLSVASALASDREIVIDIRNGGDSGALLETTATVLRERGTARVRLPDLEVGAGASTVARVPLRDLVELNFADGEQAQFIFVVRARHFDGATGVDSQIRPLNVVWRKGALHETDTATFSMEVDRATSTIFEPTPSEPAEHTVEQRQAVNAVADDGQAPPELPLDSQAAQGTVRKQSSNVSFRVCINGVSEFTDAGKGEDYMQSDQPTARPMVGNRVYVYRNNVKVDDVHLYDGINGTKGCLDYTGPSGSYRFRVWSEGRMNSNNKVRVRDDETGNWGYADVNVWPRDGGTHRRELPMGSNQMNVYAAASHAIQKHAHEANNLYDIRSNANKGFSQVSGGLIYILAGHTKRKFLIAHEVGHRVLELVTNKGGAKDCGLASSVCPASENSHSMASLEWNECAFHEGFAHFYAADAFNLHTQDDCKFVYYKDEFGTGEDNQLVDCESANGDYVTAFARNRCGPGDGGPNLVGKGTELDWVRQLWDVHTNGSADPSFGAMIRWIAGAPRWDTDGAASARAHGAAYANLDYEAQQADHSAIRGNWNAVKSFNGVGLGTADPNCDTGIQNGQACCAATCGSCGGSGCSARPGGASACCHGTITRGSTFCSGSLPPCRLF